MKTLQKSIRITDEQEKYISGQGDSFNDGLSKVIDQHLYISRYSKNELKGRFTPAEWSFFADSLNGSMIDGPFRCNQGALIAHCEDAESFEGTATKWGVSILEISEKIKALTGAQISALYSHIERFWDNGGGNLEAWSKEL
jgi:hypothetical protein